MNKAVGLSLVLTLFSLNSWAQEIDYDKRNTHIFCSSHLSLISASLDEDDNGRQALGYLSGMHRDEALKLGATEKQFDDVAGYLRKVRNNSGKKWRRLSDQSKRVCLPNSNGGGSSL